MSSGIEFEGDTNVYSNRPGSFSPNSNFQNRESKMVRWLLDKGIVKTPKAGQGVLLGIVIINIIIVYLIITYLI